MKNEGMRVMLSGFQLIQGEQSVENGPLPRYSGRTGFLVRDVIGSFRQLRDYVSTVKDCGNKQAQGEFTLTCAHDTHFILIRHSQTQSWAFVFHCKSQI